MLSFHFFAEQYFFDKFLNFFFLFIKFCLGHSGWHSYQLVKKSLDGK